VCPPILHRPHRLLTSPSLFLHAQGGNEEEDKPAKVGMVGVMNEGVEEQEEQQEEQKAAAH
jgi:hypothetical protein